MEVLLTMFSDFKALKLEISNKLKSKKKKFYLKN